MANSSIVGYAKNKIIKEFIKDQDIVDAIGCDKGDTGENLVGTHIFNYHQNPNTINSIQTFMTIQVHIPQSFGYGTSDLYVSPTIEIWIISHEKHMQVDNVPKVTENRNDYLARLIDAKLNGRDDFGNFGQSANDAVAVDVAKPPLYVVLFVQARVDHIVFCRDLGQFCNVLRVFGVLLQYGFADLVKFHGYPPSARRARSDRCHRCSGPPRRGGRQNTAANPSTCADRPARGF